MKKEQEVKECEKTKRLKPETNKGMLRIRVNRGNSSKVLQKEFKNKEIMCRMNTALDSLLTSFLGTFVRLL